MKKNKIISLIVLILSVISITAQKPAIDTSVLGKWPSLGFPPQLSNDGKYTMYLIDHLLPKTRLLVLQSIDGSWKNEILRGTYPSEFTQDNRMAIFAKPNDTLVIVSLGTSSVECIPNVLHSSFKLPKKGTSEWLAYQLNNSAKELIIRNLVTGKQQSLGSVTGYMFNDKGDAMLIQTELMKDSAVALKLVSLSDNKVTTFWKGLKAVSFSFDNSGTQLAFTVADKRNNQSENSLWYYKVGTDQAILLVDSHSACIDSGLQVDKVSSFSKDGNRVFFNLKEKDSGKPKLDAIKMDIWSYSDVKLQSQQLNEVGPKSYIATVNVSDYRITHLVREDERILPSYPPFGDRIDDLVLIESRKGSGEKWSNASKISVYLESANDDERKRKNGKIIEFLSGATLSPEGKFVVYYDPIKKNYFSYEISSGVCRNITKGIPVSWTRYDEIAIRSYDNPIGVAGWLEGDAAILIYDQYDIWIVYPAGNKPSFNLTNGFGRKHNIEFRLRVKDCSTQTFTFNEKLILSAFNRSNKDAGFYSKTSIEKGDPKLLTMGSHAYNYNGISAIKAMNAETYIVFRMSATESPNYFSTTDFKTFISLSNLYPEKAYNWLTTELMSWKTFDGSISQGILYKPESFDPKKKYPIIFYYYEKMSDELNVYQEPETAEGWINIPWFVSNGYLVFTPDIHYTVGEPGQSAYNSVVSAAKYLAKFPWVNATKMGLQGHSFGGYETNYLVTHTNLFAAAMSSSGMSDCISEYGFIWGVTGSSKQSVYESGQSYIGATLWQRPDLYIKNSPIFRADKVTTPLLMMNNKEDGAVSFAQGVEFFTALRRLGRSAWMLQYDDEPHSLLTEKARKDYTIRITQFFDHYLKGAPAPKWMLDGIPASMKGIDDGLELDTTGRIPGPGLLMEEKVKAKIK